MLQRTVYGEVTVQEILLAAGIMLFALVLAKAVTSYLRRALKEKVSRGHLETGLKVINYGIVLIAAFPAMGHMGLSLSGMMVAGGIVGIVLGFASQSIVGNLISGLFLMAERPVKIGDSVEIDGRSGVVEDIKIISTTLRTFDGLYVRIPNEKVFTNSLTNYVSNVVRRFEYVVGIRYSDSAEEAIEVIKRVLDEEPLALVEPEPQVFVDSLGDNAVNVMVRVWGPAAEWLGLKMKLLLKIKTALEAAGIEIAFPQRIVWFGDRPSHTDLCRGKDPGSPPR